MFHKFMCNLFLNNNRRRRDDNVWQVLKGRPDPDGAALSPHPLSLSLASLSVSFPPCHSPQPLLLFPVDTKSVPN